jgi:alkylresorcinol/alkylpyrone synthase
MSGCRGSEFGVWSSLTILPFSSLHPKSFLLCCNPLWLRRSKIEEPQTRTRNSEPRKSWRQTFPTCARIAPNQFVSRYIRAIYAPLVGVAISNQEMLEAIATRLETLEADDSEKRALFDFVRLLLIGHRTRYNQSGDRYLWMDTFSEHANAFASAVDQSISAIAEQIESAPPSRPFDAVFGICSEGLLLPGIAERAARRLGSLIGKTASQMDLANGGCTASVRAMELVSNLAPEIRNVLILAMEPTSTLIDPKSAARSNWQGICTFGDGAAGVWISDEPAEGALALGKLSSWRGDAIELIRWDWGTDYYRFGIADLEQFEVKVRSEVLKAMTDLQVERDPEAAWAIHPAGIMLLLSLAKKLGLARSALEPSINHFRSCSNMSSVSILHILKNILGCAKSGQQVRWLSMGAGFHVACGGGFRV